MTINDYTDRVALATANTIPCTFPGCHCSPDSQCRKLSADVVSRFVAGDEENSGSVDDMICAARAAHDAMVKP